MEEVGYCRDPNDVRLTPGADGALRRLSTAGYLNILVTNQSGIGRGYFAEESFHMVNQELFRQLGASPDAVYFCGDHPDRPSDRRKPGIGMVLEACRDHQIDLSQSWFVGDKAADIQCGHDAGCRTILVLTGYGKTGLLSHPDFVARDAGEAAGLILRAEG